MRKCLTLVSNTSGTFTKIQVSVSLFVTLVRRIWITAIKCTLLEMFCTLNDLGCPNTTEMQK